MLWGTRIKSQRKHTMYSVSITTEVLTLSLCSAGIGQTGAFCALSTAIERVKSEGLIDVFHTVKHLRTQRPHMVQTPVSSTYLTVIHHSLCISEPYSPCLHIDF